MSSDLNSDDIDPCAAAGLDCRQVLSDVYLFLDGQLDAPSRASLKAHLDECSPCLKEYGLEEHVRILVARCCSAEVAPVDLRDKVRARIATVATVVTEVTEVTEVTVVQTHSL